MRLRMLQNVGTPRGALFAGKTVEIPDDEAQKWIKQGFAMQDKSMDGPAETKSEPVISQEIPIIKTKARTTKSKRG